MAPEKLLSSRELVFAPLSKMAVSLVPGTHVQLPPPELVDQLLLVLHVPPLAPIQNRSAAQAGGR